MADPLHSPDRAVGLDDELTCGYDGMVGHSDWRDGLCVYCTGEACAHPSCIGRLGSPSHFCDHDVTDRHPNPDGDPSSRDLNEPGGTLTEGAVETVRHALAEGRVTPADLGFLKADPFGSGHGTGCASRYGHDCDCTARSADYWRAPSPARRTGK